MAPMVGNRFKKRKMNMAKKKTEKMENDFVVNLSNDELADHLDQHTFQITSRTNWENSRLIKAEAARRLRVRFGGKTN